MNQLSSEQVHVDLAMEQDEPSLEAHEREARAKANKPAYLDLSADQLNKLAVKEWREQSALRGPIVIPEWGNAAVFCRRLSYNDQRELLDINREHGLVGMFCYRALNSDGERIFKSMKLFEDSAKSRWNPVVVERVCSEMAALCKTQLTDAELGNS